MTSFAEYKMHNLRLFIKTLLINSCNKRDGDSFITFFKNFSIFNDDSGGNCH